jgi:hypothetical protein
MCVDELGLQWFKDALAGKRAPTNRAPGLCCMLCGATQHSNDTPFDRTSPDIPIGPHWMILWPFDARHCGLPTTVRDAGAWIMFAGTPYGYLHICGTPWDGNEYARAMRLGGRCGTQSHEEHTRDVLVRISKRDTLGIRTPEPIRSKGSRVRARRRRRSSGIAGFRESGYTEIAMITSRGSPPSCSR